MKDTIDKLVAFLPLFEAEKTVVGKVDYYPVYADFVEEFFLGLVSEDFCDLDYADKGIQKLETLLTDDSYIAAVTIDQCKTLLTLIMRGERFCDGYWRECIENGRVQAILRRLDVLRR